MMQIVILGLVAALAYAAPPPAHPAGMPPMMMPNMMGGSPLSFLSGSIPPEAMEMLKNLKPEDIKNAVQNMPPQMKEMVKSMGISEEQLDEAVKNLPQDLTPLVKQVTEKLESGDVKSLESIELPEPLKNSLKSTALTALKSQMSDMGMEIKNDASMEEVVDKAKTVLQDKLKEEGIDLEDPESMNAKLMAKMRQMTNASPDESDDEVKLKLAKHLIAGLKEEGFDVDPEKPKEAVEKLKERLRDSLKKLDIDTEEDIDENNFVDVMKKVVFSGKLGHPLHVMMAAMTTFTGGPQQPNQMMTHVPIQQLQPMVDHRPYMRLYEQGAEDALVHVFGNDDEVIQHLMEVREGAMRGSISEDALFELMRDLLHYRLESRVLLAQNRMLEERLATSYGHTIPPFTRSPVAFRLMGCRHAQY